MPQLPNEIWRYVFSFFESTVSQELLYWYGEGVTHHPEILSLSLVCRNFYCFVRDVLYRTVLLSVGVRRDSDEKKLAIVRTLATNTQTGSSTRAIELGRYSTWLEDSLDPFLEEVADSLDIPSPFKALLKKEPDCKGSYGPAIPFLLLDLMPKVKLVHCGYSLKIDVLVPWILGGHLGRETARTPKTTIANYLFDLEEVRLTALDGYDPVNEIEPVLLHPNIRTLHISDFECTENAIKNMKFPDHPCSVQKLVLWDCAVDASFMRNILSRCKSLHHLEIHATCWCQYIHKPNHVSMNLDEYGQALRKFGQSLVRFNLDTSVLASSRDIIGKIGSLRQLQHLRHLSITKPELVGEDKDRNVIQLTETLPLSLEMLHFYPALRFYSTPETPIRLSKDNEEIFKVVSRGRFINLRKLTFIRWGIPEVDKFAKMIEGWDIQEKGDQAVDEEDPVEMELVMNRKK